MGYRIKRAESIDNAIRRIIGEQLDKAVAELTGDELSRDEAIHQARKRCKKVRAALRLVRDRIGSTYAKQNAHYRDAARLISALRDQEALLETYDALVERFHEAIDPEGIHPVREALVQRKSEQAEQLDLDRRVGEVVEALREGNKRRDRIVFKADGFDAIAPGLKRMYRRGRDDMKLAADRGSDEDWHEWRKRVKYLRYAMKILRPIWPAVIDTTRKQLHRLSDLVGADHDLAVLRATLLGEPDRFGPERVEPLVGLIDRRRKELQAAALPLGRRIYSEKPGDFADRLGDYWSAWQDEQRLPKPLRVDAVGP